MGALTLVAAVGGALAADLGETVAGAALLVLAAGGAIRVAVAVSGTWASMVVVFSVFHAVYGLSGPIAALTGAPLPPIYSQPYQVDPFLRQVGLATIGLVSGLLILEWLARKPAAGVSQLPPVGWPLTGVLVTAVGSLMEIVNFVRAGGLPVVLQGKAMYQSAVSGLFFTLPSTQVVSIGLALTAFEWGKRPTSRAISLRHVLLVVVAASPVLGLSVALGYRSPLLEWLLVVVVGLRYTRPIRHLNGQLVGLAVAVYLASGLMFANRALLGLGILTGDWGNVWAKATEPERLLMALNPAETEFGAAFGNFSEYTMRVGSRPRFGETYLRGLALPIPGFLYPGEKPQQVSYELRDQLFPDMASQGAIAGMAYSSLLEAYVNFGRMGALGVYLLLGLLLGWIERWRARATGQFAPLVYLLLVPSGVAFHRSDFGDILSPAVMFLLVVSAYAALYLAASWLAVPLAAKMTGRGMSAGSKLLVP